MIPTTDPYLREVMYGIRRAKGTHPRQAQAPTLDTLRATLVTMPDRLYRVNGTALLIGFADGFGRTALRA